MLTSVRKTHRIRKGRGIDASISNSTSPPEPPSDPVVKERDEAAPAPLGGCGGSRSPAGLNHRLPSGSGPGDNEPAGSRLALAVWAIRIGRRVFANNRGGRLFYGIIVLFFVPFTRVAFFRHVKHGEDQQSRDQHCSGNRDAHNHRPLPAPFNQYHQNNYT